MGNLKSIDFERCTSGIEFEGWVCDLLRKLSFPADRVGKNDSGVDIIARATWNGKVHRFYIQCKYYNKPVGKTPVHEVFAGTAFHKDYGRPVVIVNNTMTYEARRYAKELGVEIISKLAFGIDTTGTPIFKSERTETFNTLMVMNGKDVFINPKYIYKNQDKIGLYKVICTRAVSAWSGNVENVITSIRVLRPNEVCTGTYSIIYYTNVEFEAIAAEKYLKTQFVRSLLRCTIDARGVISGTTFKYVPVQNFSDASDIEWTQSVADIDKQLYGKYKLTKEEIDYIETTIKPME